MPEKPDTGKRDGSRPDPEKEEIKIGVYTCYCGGNISDVVDCERVAKTLGKLPDVIASRTSEAMCSDAGQAMVEQDIKENGVNRVVIGSCTPFLHEQTFRNAVSRAGLNPYCYYHVGIREQDSWVHHGDHEGATEKAIRLMEAGIAKARLLNQLNPIRLDAEQHALVIGGGVGGLQAALEIARREIKVTLVEKSPFLGGRMAQLETIFPTGELARDALHRLVQKVIHHPHITIYTGAEVSAVKGYVGDFQVQVRRIPRGTDASLSNVEAAMAACPIGVPDEFNYGLTRRKAIYQPYEGSYPETPAIDWENCTRCGKCLEAVGRGIHLDGEPEIIRLKAGAIVVATGFDPYQPHPGEYGYRQVPQVITLPELIRLLALGKDKRHLEWNGHPVRNVAMIHCVGSRQVEGVNQPQPDGQVNNYCSRVCCTATLRVANEIRERFPEIQIFDLYQDIRTYGRGHEDYYVQASKNDVRFLRYHADEPPQVAAAEPGDPYPVVVKVKDYLTWGKELEIPVDLVVLSVGFMPRQIDDLIHMLKISPGPDRFLLEVHPKLRPVETAVSGIVLAGSAQGPMNIQESVAAASAAASKVTILLGKGNVELEPFVAHVNPDRCTGSGECVKACAYEDAITLESLMVNGEQVQRAVVSPANCTGCGVCVSACPNRAIDVQGYELDKYEAMVDAILADVPALEEAVT
jgi:heterodisulfide reductase subunit A